MIIWLQFQIVHAFQNTAEFSSDSIPILLESLLSRKLLELFIRLTVQQYQPIHVLCCHRESLHTVVHNRLSSRDLKLRRPHFQNGRQNNDAKEHGQKESPLTKSLPHLLNLVSRPHFLSDFPGFGLGEKVSVNWIIWCLEEIQHVIYFFCLILFYGFWAPDSAPWFWTTYSNLLMDCFDNSEEEKMCLWLCFSVRLIKKASK